MQYPDLKNVVGATAFTSGTVQFLSGIPVCKKIIRNKTTGDLPALTFVSSFAAAACWFLYGITISDKSTIYVNAIGALLQLGYAMVYYKYSMRKSTMMKLLGGSTLGLLLATLYVYKDQNQDRKKLYIGLLSTCVTILTFSTPLFKLKTVMRERSTQSLPFPIILMTFITSSQWLIYGLLIKDKFMMVVNVIGSLLSLIQLSLFIIYKGDGTISTSEGAEGESHPGEEE